MITPIIRNEPKAQQEPKLPDQMAEACRDGRTDPQCDRWKEAAKASGKSLSEWLRDLANQAAEDAGV